MNRIQVRIDPPKWPDDPEEQRKLVEEMSNEGKAGTRRDFETLKKIMDDQKKAPPSDFLIGNAA